MTETCQTTIFEPRIRSLLDDVSLQIIRELQARRSPPVHVDRKDGRAVRGRRAPARAAAARRGRHADRRRHRPVARRIPPPGDGRHHASTATSASSRPSSRASAEIDYVVICSGSYDLLVELTARDDEHLLEVINTQIRSIPGVRSTEDVRVPAARKADLHLGYLMTRHDSIARLPLRKHLWMHFTPITPTGHRRPGHRRAARVRGSTTSTARSTSTGSRACSCRRSGTAGPSSPTPPPKQAEQARVLPGVELRAPSARSSSPNASPTSRPAISTACSSRRAAAKPSSRRGSSRASTSRRSANRTATR